ncbi:MAG: ECF-type sigma factor [Gemmatimonadaceae bacterium]
MAAEPSQITALLERWTSGESEALDHLIPVLYDELRELAHQRLRRAPGELSLNTTGLVHEAYLKLVDASPASIENRRHFFGIASRLMRNVLVDHTRARTAAKRGGGVGAVELREHAWIDRVDLEAVAELDEALQRLEKLDARQSRIVEQRYFGGLSLEETASALDISLATVKRELRIARAWLASELGREASA